MKDPGVFRGSLWLDFFAATTPKTDLQGSRAWLFADSAITKLRPIDELNPKR